MSTCLSRHKFGRQSFVAILAITALALSVIGCARAGTGGGGTTPSPWPCNHGGASQCGYSPVDTSKVSGAVCWDYPLPLTFMGNPVIGGDGTIYTVSWGAMNYTTREWASYPGLYAIDGSGGLKWCFRFDELADNTQGYWRSINPAVDNQGNVYLSINGKNLYSIDNAGNIRWNVTIDNYIAGAGFVIDQASQIYMNTYGSVLCLNPNGTERWHHQFDDASQAYSYTIPAVDDGGNVVAVVEDNMLVKMSSTGSLLWSNQIKNASFEFPIATQIAPAISSGGIIIAGAVDSRLYAFNGTGNLLWIIQMDRPISQTPSIGKDGTIYVVSGEDTLTAIGCKGTTIWTFTNNDGLATAPIVDAVGNVYVGANGGSLYAFDKKGNERWQLNVTKVNERIARAMEPLSYSLGTSLSSPAVGADGRLYLYTGLALICVGWNEKSITLPIVLGVSMVIAVPAAAILWWWLRTKP